MSLPRVLLAGGGLVLALSLFLPWFAGVTGWEQWKWADVVLIVLAADLVATAFLRPIAAQRAIVAVLCALGIAVVLGHGFEPDAKVDGFEHIAAGPYLALAALAAGAVGAVAAWPRKAAPLLLVVAAGGIVAALLSGWGIADRVDVQPGWTAYAPIGEPNGFERWRVLDVALLALAAGLVAAASGRLPSAALAVLGVGAVAAVACVLAGARSRMWTGDGGAAEGIGMGTLAALLALAAALAGLALLRPRPRRTE